MAMESQPVILITVRLIRSFEHRNIKYIVYKDIPLDMTVKKFMEFVKADIQNRKGLPPPFKMYSYDTFKIHHKPFGAKAVDPAIDRENDELLILKEDLTLQESNIESDMELALFKREDYEKYKANPVVAW